MLNAERRIRGTVSASASNVSFSPRRIASVCSPLDWKTLNDGIFGRFPPANTRVFATTPRRAARSDNSLICSRPNVPSASGIKNFTLPDFAPLALLMTPSGGLRSSAAPQFPLPRIIAESSWLQASAMRQPSCVISALIDKALMPFRVWVAKRI